MAYFKIGETDFSNVVSALSVSYQHNYNALTNAAGDTVMDYINRKRKIEVEIIPIADTQMQAILNAVNEFGVTIYLLEPKTGTLLSVNCAVADYQVQYYTIQQSKTQFQKFKLVFNEL